MGRAESFAGDRVGMWPRANISLQDKPGDLVESTLNLIAVTMSCDKCGVYTVSKVDQEVSGCARRTVYVWVCGDGILPVQGEVPLRLPR